MKKPLQLFRPQFNSPSQQSRPPVAPPVYRPQPVPKVLQRKTTPNLQLAGRQPARAPVAPPVYRPQPVPHVITPLQGHTKVQPIVQPKKPFTIQPKVQPMPLLSRGIINANSMTLQGVIQRKLKFGYSGGVITECEFTKRPGWSTHVVHALPSVPGHDRGHLIAWMALRLELERNLLGKTNADAYTYLQARGHQPNSTSWADIERAIRELGRDENNDLDNLEYEDSSQNRSNGAKLPRAAAIWDAIHGKKGQVWNPPYYVTDTNNNPVTLTTKAAAEQWCLSVGVSDNATGAEVKAAADRFSKDPCVVM